MASHADGAQAEVRPYRSHKVPACTACRQRKVRCNVEDPGLPCRYCRERFFDCDHGVSRAQQSASVPRATKRRHASTGAVSTLPLLAAGQSVTAQSASEEARSIEDSSPVMINPSMAEDVDALERHLASHSELGVAETRPYVRLSNAKGESIVYRKVAKRRQGLQQTTSPGSVQLEIIENVLGPLKQDVLELYDTTCAP